MGLFSLGGLGVIICDVLITGLVLVSVLLSVWHIFDKSVGTDIDWLIALIFIMVAFLYETIIKSTITIHWDRIMEIKCIITYFGCFAFLIWLAFKDAQIGTEN